MPDTTRAQAGVLLVILLPIAAPTCSPHGGRGPMMGGRMPMMGQASADTAAAPKPTAVAAESTGTCPGVSQPLVDEGRHIFGTSGNCYACHGPDAAGTAVAPKLTDTIWLDTDGSYASIIALIHSGVPHPKQFPAPMPPKGGAALSDAQVCAVAAYVRALGGSGQ